MNTAENQMLRPDPVTIQSFMDWWFHHATRGVIQIGWRDGTTGELNRFRDFEIGAEDIGDTIAAINSIPGQSVYFRASTVRAGVTTGAADADFAQCPGIWGDLDDAGAYQRAATIEAMIRPSGWVVTGKHPHWRAQCFWRLEGICENPAAISALNRRVVALYNSDPSVTNPTRLMRVPGTIAWPSKPGRVPELTELVMPAGRAQSHSIEFLTARLPQERAAQPPPQEEAPTGGLGGIGGVTVATLLRAMREPGKWHNSVLRLVGHWISRGWSDAEILATAGTLTLPGYSTEQTARDLQVMINGGRAKWGVGNTDHTIFNEPASPYGNEIMDPWDALKPVKFPLDALPSVIADFVLGRSEAVGCDPAAVAMSCLSALSAAIDGRSRLRMKQHDSWAVPPGLWVALVGAPSAKKSPAVRAAWQPLEAIQGRTLAAYANELRLWEAQPKDARGDKPRPPTRYVSHDATIEALQGIMANQDRGLGILRDELAGWIGGMERYSGGKGGADRAFFLQSFDAGAYVADRVGRGTVPINNLALTVCGGIQPDRLATMSDLTDDGLWQRFIPVVMGAPTLGQDVPQGEAGEAYAALVQHVAGLSTIHAELAPGARAARERFEKWLFEFEQTDALGPSFSSFLGKLAGVWGRLALVMHAIDPGLSMEVVSARHAEAATRLVVEYIIPSAARVYVSMSVGASSISVTRDIAGFILVKKLDRIVASDMSRNVRSTRRATLPEITRALSPLVAGGWLAPEKDHAGNNSWVVNPRVHELLAHRAASEEGRRAHLRRFIAEELDK